MAARTAPGRRHRTRTRARHRNVTPASPYGGFLSPARGRLPVSPDSPNPSSGRLAPLPFVVRPGGATPRGKDVMSDSSWTRVPSTTGRALVPGLLRSLDPLLRAWLPRQRWFAGKGLPVGQFHLAAATELVPPGGRLGPLGLLHVLVDVEQPGRPAD